jgi:hypothetical protein
MPCCILAGDADGDGLDMVMPVAGLMMGIAFRVRVADGWCSFRVECWLWNAGGMKAGEDEFRENVGAMVLCGWLGEPLGDSLASDDLSDDPLCMETSCRR